MANWRDEMLISTWNARDVELYLVDPLKDGTMMMFGTLFIPAVAKCLMGRSLAAPFITAEGISDNGYRVTSIRVVANFNISSSRVCPNSEFKVRFEMFLPRRFRAPAAAEAAADKLFRKWDAETRKRYAELVDAEDNA